MRGDAAAAQHWAAKAKALAATLEAQLWDGARGGMFARDAADLQRDAGQPAAANCLGDSMGSIARGTIYTYTAAEKPALRYPVPRTLALPCHLFAAGKRRAFGDSDLWSGVVNIDDLGGPIRGATGDLAVRRSGMAGRL